MTADSVRDPNRLCAPTVPITKAPAMANAKNPNVAERPEHECAAAPGKPMTATVCPVKLCLRSTMNQPTAAATTATTVPA